MAISRMSPETRLKKTAAETTLADRTRRSCFESRVREAGSAGGMLIHLPDFNTLIDVLGLCEIGKLQSRKTGGSGPGGNTPAQGVGEVRALFHGPRKRGGQSIAGADWRNGRDVWGDHLDDLMVERAHGTLASH